MKRFIFLAISAIIVNLCATAADYDPRKAPFWGQRSSLFDALPVDSTDIIMLGNSLTNGGEWHELFNMPNVKNRGISSDIVEGVRLRLGSVVKGQPKKIFLLIGVNDISHALESDSIAGAIIALADSILKESPRTKLYVQSCLPFNLSFGYYKALKDREHQVPEINAILRNAANDHGYTFIDLYSSFAGDDGLLRPELTNDGLHLIAPGYLLWRDLLLPYVKE